MDNSLDIFRIKTNNIAPKKGRILIAEPFLPGDFFSRSVIILVSYSKKGVVGFILNKKIDYPMQELFPDFPDFNARVYLGGPVANDSLYYIHQLENVKGSIHVLGKLYWGGDFDEIKNLISLGLVKSSEIRFFLGYSGWDGGQLEREIKEDSWLVTDGDENMVIHEPDETLWIEFVRKAGSRYKIWENFPENPLLN